jgi:predicted  nucleic acid-binding Zn-ribbon protein
METPQEKIARLRDELAQLKREYDDLGLEMLFLENEITEAEEEIL